jgi:hypothetical protein
MHKTFTGCTQHGTEKVSLKFTLLTDSPCLTATAESFSADQLIFFVYSSLFSTWCTKNKSFVSDPLTVYIFLLLAVLDLPGTTN